MRSALASAALLLLQGSQFRAPQTDIRYLRYERSITLPAGAGGEACAVLDATAFAHAASRSGNDLRVFREAGGEAPVEIPFTVTESESAPGEAEPARALRVVATANRLSFDLQMPARAYTAVDLQLAAKDFVGIATVSGRTAADDPGTPPNTPPDTPLGSFAVFDLSSQGLGRSTELALQESAFAVLHVDLQLWAPQLSTAQRLPFAGASAAMVGGASVPPSREAQTLYTVVARAPMTREGSQFSAAIPLPPHVPVDRVSFDLDPLYHGSFHREVTVAARPADAKDDSAVEVVNGVISRVDLPLYLDANPEAVIYQHLSLPAALAANLRSGATVRVSLQGSTPALPIRELRLEMRQRMICFLAQPGAHYTLRYGDAALVAPVYTSGAPASSEAVGPVLTAFLGDEQQRPGYLARAEQGDGHERHPETSWLILLAAVTAVGGIAMQRMRRQGRR